MDRALPLFFLSSTSYGVRHLRQDFHANLQYNEHKVQIWGLLYSYRRHAEKTTGYTAEQQLQLRDGGTTSIYTEITSTLYIDATRRTLLRRGAKSTQAASCYNAGTLLVDEYLGTIMA